MLIEPNLVIYGFHVSNLVVGGVFLKGGCSGEEGGSDIKDPGYHSCYWGDGQGARVALGGLHGLGMLSPSSGGEEGFLLKQGPEHVFLLPQLVTGAGDGLRGLGLISSGLPIGKEVNRVIRKFLPA